MNDCDCVDRHGLPLYEGEVVTMEADGYEAEGSVYEVECEESKVYISWHNQVDGEWLHCSEVELA